MDSSAIPKGALGLAQSINHTRFGERSIAEPPTPHSLGNTVAKPKRALNAKAKPASYRHQVK